MKKHYTLLLLLIGSGLFAQTGLTPLPESEATGVAPDWTIDVTRDASDSCGAYFNNYIGLTKTSDLYYESLRVGDASDFNQYPGRAQRFHAYQEIEISGIQFYGFKLNDAVDSLMVITYLFDYNESLDSVGAELARDTVWVSHPEFTPVLPELEVNSYFDEPVVVNEDYMIAIVTPTNDSLKIITSDPSGDGAGEGVSFAYYDHPLAPSYTGWYNSLETFGPIYDLDYLMNPLVKYKMHNGFTLDNDTICPNIVSAACVEYNQVANFSDPHYNGLSDTPEDKILWNWGDGLQNEDLTTLCHTYEESGTLTITLIDSIQRHNFAANICAIEVTKTIVIRDSSVANATFTYDGSTVNFDGDPSLSTSVFWDFGDGNSSSSEDPTYTYSEIGTYDVWFYAIGPCNTDSVLLTVTTDDVGIDRDGKLDFTLYPNPANNQLEINGLEAGTIIQIHSILGEEVYQTVSLDNRAVIDTNNLPNGTYLIRITTGNVSTTKKVMVQH